MNQSSNLKLQALAIGSLPHDNVEEAKFIANNEELIAHQFALSMIEYVYTKYSKK